MSARSASRNAKVITSLSLLACLSLCQVSILGQTPSSARYEAVLRSKAELNAENVSLSQMLQRLHKEHRLNFVVAGVPLRKKATIQSSGTIANALDALSAEFDYNWAIDKRGIILFTKAFREDGDIPQIHEAEIKRLAKETLEIFRSVPVSDVSWNEEVRKLAKTFTPEQWFVLKTGQSISAQSLAPAQWQQIQLAGVANQVTDEKRRWQTFHDLLTQLNTAVVRVRPLKINSTPRARPDGKQIEILPYRLFLYSKSSDEHPLYDFAFGLTATGDEGGNRQEERNFRLQEVAYFEEVRGREHPERVKGRWSKLVTFSQEKTTLGELLPLLSTPDELQYQAIPEQTSRLLQVYCTNITKRALTDAIAELEDWHWQESKQGKVQFVRRPLKDIGDYTAIPRRIQVILPRDLCSYFDVRRPTLMASEMKPTFIYDAGHRKMLRFNVRKMKFRDHGIRGLIEKLSASGDDEAEISIAKLKPEDRRLLLTALLGETLNYMQYGIYGGDFPPYIYAPETAELEISGDVLQIASRYRDGKGNPVTGFGGNVADIIPKNSNEGTSNP